MRHLKWFVTAALMCSGPAAGQSADQDAQDAMLRGERDVTSSEARQQRFESSHLILYVDNGALARDAARRFASQLERSFVGTADLLRRKFDTAHFKVQKPSYYLTDRAGISHVNGARVFLRAARVVDSPAIAVHETVHLLLETDPAAPRMLPDTPPEIDATTGGWLGEGLASHISTVLAPRLGLAPDHLFLKGDASTLDAEAKQWLNDTRGKVVLPYIGSRGYPPSLLADRVNVAPPFYVLSESFVTFVTARAGVQTVARLYVEHLNGRAPIEDDVRRITGIELAQWRADWLRSLGQ